MKIFNGLGYQTPDKSPSVFITNARVIRSSKSYIILDLKAQKKAEEKYSPFFIVPPTHVCSYILKNVQTGLWIIVIIKIHRYSNITIIPRQAKNQTRRIHQKSFKSSIWLCEKNLKIIIILMRHQSVQANYYLTIIIFIEKEV